MKIFLKEVEVVRSYEVIDVRIYKNLGCFKVNEINLTESGKIIFELEAGI